MFPSQELTTTTKNSTTGKTMNFDFETGDFVVKDGKVVTLTGLEGLEMWITKVLKTDKNKFKIYNTDNVEKYGVTLLELVTSDYPRPFIEAQVQAAIIETLMKNSDIKAVYNFSFTRDKRTLIVNFTVTSVYGITEKKVII